MSAPETPSALLKTLQDTIQNRFAGRFSLDEFDSAALDFLIATGTNLATATPVVFQIARGISRQALVRLQHETHAARASNCSFVPDQIDAAFDDQLAVVVDQYVVGMDLAEYVRQESPNVRQSIELAIELFTALNDLHSVGIHHHDVRPQKVIIDADGHANLIRRDIAEPGDPNQESQLQRASFLSPEQAGSIERDVAEPADLYSAGAVLFFILTGRPPFEGNNVSSILLSHMIEPVPQFKDAELAVPRNLEKVVSRLLAKDPGNRYQTASGVLHDLKEIAAGLDTGAAEPELVVASHDDRKTLIEPSFVGRRTELQHLALELSEAQRGKPRVVLLEGISGAGKSRLLLEFYQHAATQRFQLYRGQGTTNEADGVFSILNGVVEDFISNASGNPDFVQQFLKSFEGEVDYLVSLLPRLQEVIPSTGSVEEGPDDFAENRQLRNLCGFLNAIGSDSQPALIILDDCQWADSRTCKLLNRLALETTQQSRRPVLFLFAFRSDEVGPDHPIRAIKRSGQISLKELSDKEVRLVAESMAGTLPEQAIDLVIDAAGGSPFMASAVVRGLYESEAIVRSESGWVINEKAFAACQSSNEAGEFLTRRLDLLSPSAVEFLSTGAVLGKEFDFALVSYLSGQDASSSVKCFDEARHRHMVWVRGDGYGLFSHDKIREALLLRLTDEQRRDIHLRAGEYLERQSPQNAIQIAFHYDEAGDPQRALPFALTAAEVARTSNSLESAKKLYQIAERAQDKNAEEDTLFRLNVGLGEVLMLLGEYEPAEEHFLIAESYAEGTLAQAQILGQLAEVGRKRGDLEKAIVSYEAALGTLGYPVPNTSWKFNLGMLCETIKQVCTTFLPTLLLHRARREPNDSERLCITLLSGLAHSYWYARGKSETLWAHFRGMNLGEKFRPSEELANAYSEHAPVMCLLRMFGRAERYARKSIEIRTELENIWGQGQSKCFLACAYYAASRFEEALSVGRESVRLLERAGDYWYVHIARYQMAAALFRLGRKREALAECEKNYASGMAIGDEQTTGVILHFWAQITGGLVPRNYLDIEVARDRIDMQTRCEVLIAQGINVMRDDIDAAVGWFDQGIKVIRDSGVSNCYTVSVYFWRTHALRIKAERQDGALEGHQRIQTLRSALRSAVRGLLESWLSANDLPRMLRELALIRNMQGHPQQARWLLHRSINLADQIRAHGDYAESLNILGELGQQLGWPDADENASRAKALLNRLAVNSGVEDDTNEAQPSETLSLADRFDTILGVGRRITLALAAADVYEQTRLATLRLLRCENCVILDVTDAEYSLLAGKDIDVNFEAIREAIGLGRANASNLGQTNLSDNGAHGLQGGSLMCAPIMVAGRVTACVYATHDEVRDLFGPTEMRLADFVATIAGASLENAQQYDELQTLNLTLEDRVAERTEAAEARARELAVSNQELERTANDLRSTEEQLREAIKEANSANEAKSRFLATMSHEIRTPMNGILGMTDLLMRSSVTHQQASCLKVVKQSGDTLLTLLNDILDLSKIEAGKMELENIEFELRDVVENSVRLLATSAQTKNLEVICEIDNNLPKIATGDPGRIRQVLTNLIGNAVKFTSEGEIHVAARCMDDSIEFSVRDTGIGIPEDKQDLIFDAFKQSDSSTTRQFGGTGLGLSICRTLVEMMGGKIGVESVDGRGSTFKFNIPFSETKSSQFALGIDELRGLVGAVVSKSEAAAKSRALALECLGLSVMCFDTFYDLHESGLDCFDVVLIEEDLIENWMQRNLDTSNVITLSQKINPMDGEIVEVTKPPVLDELGRAVQILLGSEPLSTAPATDITKDVVGCRILLADDSIVNQEVASGLLEHSGHSVAIANNGLEAVELFRSQDFDLILMDIEMPEVDGLEATRRIRDLESETEGSKEIPIVAMSAHAVMEKEAACFDAGIDAYIAKPFDPDQLLGTIAELTSKERAAAT